MQKGICPVCGQEIYDPLLSELKMKDSNIDRFAKELLDDILAEIVKSHREHIDKISRDTDTYKELVAMISMALMPEEG